MHQDHGQSPAVCQGAINLGFSSVMMDGSLLEDGKTPAMRQHAQPVQVRPEGTDFLLFHSHIVHYFEQSIQL
jgi:hypothetical protein